MREDGAQSWERRNRHSKLGSSFRLAHLGWQGAVASAVPSTGSAVAASPGWFLQQHHCLLLQHHCLIPAASLPACWAVPAPCDYLGPQQSPHAALMFAWNVHLLLRTVSELSFPSPDIIKYGSAG